MQLKVKLLHPKAQLPQYKHEGDSGLDLHSIQDITLPGLSITKVRTGLAIEPPPGYEAQIRPRSGLADKHNIVGFFGTGDNPYRGEIEVLLINLNLEPYQVHIGDRIAQLVVAPVTTVKPVVVEALSETDRGTGGFGSTGP